MKYMSVVDDVIDSINEQIDVASDLHPGIKFLICIVLTAIGYYLVKYAVVRPWGRVVMSTDTAWDDKLHRPVANLSLIHI